MKKYSFWNEVSDRATAHERILTGHRGDAVLPADPSLPEFIKDEKIKKVLDFGCGVGRNTFYFAEIYDDVWAFDWPNMTDMLKSDKRWKEQFTVTNDWNEVKKQKFDAIFCSIVLQHITNPELDNYLKDMSTITDRLLVFTRGYLDKGQGDIFPHLYKHFKIKEETEVIPDRNANSAASKETHYRLYLVPKND